jgi:hypothetical protein
MDLETELSIRRARIAELEARDRIRGELRQGETERMFWARVEASMHTEPSAAERYQQHIFDAALDLIEEIQASRAERDADDASGQWGGGVE